MSDIEKTRVVPSYELRAGMIVRTPLWVVDDGETKAFRDVWPDPPPRLRVDYWHWVDGETLLIALDGSGSIDQNAVDYPPMFEVEND